jgi:hypothetical protein
MKRTHPLIIFGLVGGCVQAYQLRLEWLFMLCFFLALILYITPLSVIVSEARSLRSWMRWRNRLTDGKAKP